MTGKKQYRIDLTGKRFGRLKVISFHERKKGAAYWKCICDCGNITVKQGSSLSYGCTRSCGCLSQENRSKVGKANKKHKCDDQRLLAVWRSMMFRCESPKSNRYHIYGGRGIKVCDEWHDIDVFTDWALANGYQHGLTIDRIDVDGMYCPENCRFVSKKEQANNKRTNVFLEYNGERKTIADWSRATGIPYGTLMYRVRKHWRPEDILTIPVSQYNNNINRRNMKEV